ncbi:MAG TPA: phosphate-starvation-inducible PsiE family protein [Nostocaceae cyanobacterium]|nr:phosphate-starvation-inducible PsiE family protein [Nostocaceae cyanobacterium]
MKRTFHKLIKVFKHDETFNFVIEHVEVIVAKVLSIFMVIVIFAMLIDLGIFLYKELFTTSYDRITDVVFKVFGFFLNVLIALEILENITAYLKKHVFQIELVIATSLIALARKIIILKLDEVTGTQIIGLGIAILSLSICYFIVRSSHQK